MQDLKISNRLLVYFSSLTVCSGDIKKSCENEEKKALNMQKKALKMKKSLGHFQSFFCLFSVPF